MNLAIDVASGEKPVEELVLGAVSALPENNDINLILVGNERYIAKALSGAKYDRNRVDVKHTDEIIDMNESPANGIKHKKNASVLLAARLVSDKTADGFFSPGNTRNSPRRDGTKRWRFPQTTKEKVEILYPPLLTRLPR